MCPSWLHYNNTNKVLNYYVVYEIKQSRYTLKQDRGAPPPRPPLDPPLPPLPPELFGLVQSRDM